LRWAGRTMLRDRRAAEPPAEPRSSASGRAALTSPRPSRAHLWVHSLTLAHGSAIASSRTERTRNRDDKRGGETLEPWSVSPNPRHRDSPRLRLQQARAASPWGQSSPMPQVSGLVLGVTLGREHKWAGAQALLGSSIRASHHDAARQDQEGVVLE
jgi:hypothetical protein